MSKRQSLFRLLGSLCLALLVVSFTFHILGVGPRSFPPPKASVPSRPQPGDDDSSHGLALTTPDTALPTAWHTSTPQSSHIECPTLPGAEDIVVAFKIGAEQVHEKLPTHLLTLLKCVPHHAIFSNLEQTAYNQRIYDAFANISASVKEKHEEFRFYEKIKELYVSGQDISQIESDVKGDDRTGWKLDKWRTLWSFVLSYQIYPDKKWYLLIDPDTAVMWTNLLIWTTRMSPDELLYTGSQNSYGGITFAHGGSGILVSRAAIRRIVENLGSHEEKWHEDIGKSCCGDVELSRQFQDSGVKFTPSFPILQGESPLTIDWNSRHMCAPAVGWHHLSLQQVEELWTLQQGWTDQHGYTTPILFRDIFPHFVTRYMADRRDDWDNISADRVIHGPDGTPEKEWNSLSDVERLSVDSFEACKQFCIASDNCLQFKHRPGECALGENIRIGSPNQHHNRNTWVSGWIRTRINAFHEKFKDCQPNWSFDQ